MEPIASNRGSPVATARPRPVIASASPTIAPESSSRTTGSSGFLVRRMKSRHPAPSRSGAASRAAVRSESPSRTTATPSTTNPTPGLSTPWGVRSFSTPSNNENIAPREKSTRATTNAQKNRSAPYPNGWAASAGRRARLPPRKSKPWFPVSAKEWMDSASIDAEPVTIAAATFATAMPRLASRAATIAARAVLHLAVPDHPRRRGRVAEVLTGNGTEELHRRVLVDVPDEHVVDAVADQLTQAG